MPEARRLHVSGQRLLERAAHTAPPFIVWDVGLGAAANAIAVLEALHGQQVELHSFDCSTAPLEFALAHAAELEYVAPFRQSIERLLAHGNTSLKAITWSLHRGDFQDALNSPDLPAPDAILYDPYSPASNPELWTLEHFTRLHARLDPRRPCLWSNYTRSTAVRVTLLLAGFFVGAGPAIGEKDETTLAANDPGLLAAPLGSDWLARVQRSTRGAPLRAGKQRDGAISSADWESLVAHPQFVSAEQRRTNSE